MSAHERTKRFTILLRKGDQVKVMAGKDAGKSGRVLSVNPRKNTVVVEHANIIKRHPWRTAAARGLASVAARRWISKRER